MTRWPMTLLASLGTLALLLATGPGYAGDPAAPELTAVAKPVDLQNEICPVKGIPVKPSMTEVVNGTIVHFCCPMCAAKYQKDPAAFEATLRKEPAVAQRLDAVHAAQLAAPAPAQQASKASDLHDGMRKLWEDHVSWTRLFVVSTLGGLPDREAATKRLLQNQVDIGDAIKPYYGDAAGTQLTVLLKAHILAAADLVGALMRSDSDRAAAAKTTWQANADEIATLLSSANPAAWPLSDMKAMMREHLDLTTAEVAARLAHDWEADIAAYTRIRDQALTMADMLCSGIQQQFPGKFR